LVRSAGGDLIVVSRPGAGTTVRVLLPCRASAANNTVLASAVEAKG